MMDVVMLLDKKEQNTSPADGANKTDRHDISGNKNIVESGVKYL
jgi:hypothetical protein